jgi:ParB/RepB/Spo0J family partition protein
MSIDSKKKKKEKSKMNTAVAVNASKVVPHGASSVLDIPLTNIQESRTNPRRQFDETKLAQLADNISQHGVLQPVLVRPLPGGESGFYELVAGARRYRASRLAGRGTISASVRELTDTQCLELQLIENLQRADVHELDEARGYAALMQLQPETYTVETLAEKIGRSEKYVYARLRLTHLVDEVQQAFYAAKLTSRMRLKSRISSRTTNAALCRNAFRITGGRRPSPKTRKPKRSPCGNSASGLSGKSTWTSRTRHLTRRTKACCLRQEVAHAAQNGRGTNGRVYRAQMIKLRSMLLALMVA